MNALISSVGVNVKKKKNKKRSSGANAHHSDKYRHSPMSPSLFILINARPKISALKIRKQKHPWNLSCSLELQILPWALPILLMADFSHARPKGRVFQTHTLIDGGDGCVKRRFWKKINESCSEAQVLWHREQVLFIPDMIYASYAVAVMVQFSRSFSL